MDESERIKRLRKNLGWTQRQFADFIGIGYQHISNIERGRKKPGTQLIRHLEERFGKDFGKKGSTPVPYPEPPEQFGIPADHGAGTEEILEKAREILESEEVAVAEALRANVCQFHRLIRERRRIRDLEQEVARAKEVGLRRIRALESRVNELQEALRQEKNTGGSSAGPEDMAGGA